jgi:peptidoglycan/LPS O-acetylase OafA/YrhL
LNRSGERHRLVGLQICRGVAALLVVVYHGGRMVALPQYAGYVPLGNAFAFGHAGVDFFFVLSGLIITLVHGGDVGRPGLLARYLWRRLIRIYPIYWMVAAAVTAGGLFAGHSYSFFGLAASALLIPHEDGPILGVAWTLEHEMLFYGLFALAIWRRQLVAPLVATALLLMVLALYPPWREIAALRFLGHPCHLQFLMGVGSALIVRNRPVRAPYCLAAVGAGGFLLVGIGEDGGVFASGSLTETVLFGLASAMLLVGLVAAERSGRLRPKASAAMLGAASYSIYLIHTVVIGALAHLLATCGVLAYFPGWALLVVVGVAAVAAGLALHVVVEAPLMLRLSGRWLQPPRDAVHRVPVGF